MSVILNHVCSTTRSLCQIVVFVFFRDLTNIYWNKEIEDLENQNDLSSVDQDNSYETEMNQIFTTVEVNDGSEKYITENENNYQESRYVDLSQIEDDFYIREVTVKANSESSYITDDDIYARKMFGDNIELNHENKELIKDFEILSNDTSESFLRNLEGEILNISTESIINYETIEVPLNINNIKSPKAGQFSEVKFTTATVNIDFLKDSSTLGKSYSDKCSENDLILQDFQNEIDKYVENHKLPGLILEPQLNSTDSNNQITEISENYLQLGIIESFCDTESDNVDWIKKFLAEIVAECCFKDEEKQINCNDHSDHVCKCYENHGCLQVVNIEDDGIAAEILTERQLVSVDTGSVSDWLYKVNPAICLLPSSDVFDVSKNELQDMYEQELNQNKTYTEERFNEKYVKQWLEETEKFCSNSSLSAGDDEKY